MRDAWARLKDKVLELNRKYPWFMPVALFAVGILAFISFKLLGNVLKEVGHAFKEYPFLGFIVSPVIMVTLSWWMNRTSKGVVNIRVEKPQELPAFKDFAGLDSFKDEMTTVARRCFGLDPRAEQLKIVQRGVLLYGEPGCGKTHFVRCLAGEAQSDLIHCRVSDMQSSFVGGISGEVAKIFDFCLRYTRDGTRRLILFLDEMEGIAPSRTSNVHEEAKKGVQTLLACIDESQRWPNFLLIGATNHPDTIDDAVKREGRIAIRKEFPAPDEDARREIIKLFLVDRAEATEGEFDLEPLVLATHGRSVAAINGALQNAASLALKDNRALTQDLLMSAFRQGREGRKPPQPPVTWEEYIGDPALLDLGKKLAADLMDPVIWGRKDTRPIQSVLLYSEPGMGKTYWVKAVATAAGASFYEINTSTIATKWIGEPEVKIQALFKEARDNRPAIVFMDEIDSIAGKRRTEDGGNVAEVNNRIVNCLLTELDGAGKSNNQLLIIAATNRYDAVDDAIKRPGRFMKHVHIPPPSVENRGALFRFATRRAATDSEIDFDLVAKSSEHFSNDDVASAARIALEAAKKRGEEAGEEPMVTQDDLIAGVREIRYRGMERPSREQYDWDKIIVPRRTREECELALKMLTDIKFLEESGLTPPLGIVFDGPPGTGKTQIAKTMAAQADAGYIEIRPPDLLAAGGLQRLDALVNRAIKASPSVVFIDELDALLPKRSAQGENVLVNTFLQAFNRAREKGNVLVVGATNFYEKIDEAILRPGRLEGRITMDLPDTECRERLWRLYLRDVPDLAPELSGNEIPPRLVDDSEGLSPAEIMGAVEAARRETVKARMARGERTSIQVTDLLTQVQKLNANRNVGLIMERPSRDRYHWDAVIVPAATRRDCRLSLELLIHPDKALARGITPPLGVIFEGPPGTGKTLLAKTMAAEAGVNYFELQKDHFLSGGADVTANVRKVFDRIGRSLPAIVFLDECENLLRSREQGASDLVNALLKAITDLGDSAHGRVLVVGATNYYDRIDAAIVRSGRLEKRITVGLPDAEGRRKLWDLYLAQVPDSAWDPQDPIADHLDELVEASARRSPADIKSALETAKMLSLGREMQGEESPWMQLADILEALRASAKADVCERPDPAVYHWEALILPEEVKEDLKLAIQLLTDPSLRREHGIKQTDLGILLVGPPGTGKTQAAKTMAAMAGAAYIEKQPAQIKAKYLGESEQNIAAIFDDAINAAPCIMFLDEIDAVCPERSRMDDGIGAQAAKSIVDQFLQSMNKAKEAGGVLVIGATNHPEDVDEAIRRPGRLGQCIELPLPDVAGLEQLWALYLGQQSQVDPAATKAVPQLAAASKGLSPSAINSAVGHAQKAAFLRAHQIRSPSTITPTDLPNVLTYVTPALLKSSPRVR